MEMLRQKIKDVYEKYKPSMLLYNTVFRRVAELRSYELELEMYRDSIEKLTPPKDDMDKELLKKYKKLYERKLLKKKEIEKELRAIARLLCREEQLLGGEYDED